ncbi:MAG: hypothetical protein SNJ82_10155 [Gemmataceae bacterium]
MPELRGLVGGGPGGRGSNKIWDWLKGLGARELARRELPHLLEIMNRAVETTKLPVKDQFAAEASLPEKPPEIPRKPGQADEPGDPKA